MLLTFLSVVAASVNSTLLHKTQSYTKREVYRFNSYCAVIWIIMLLFLNGGLPNVNQNVLSWGLLYGTAQVLFLLFKTKAMATGPVSVTTLVGNCSLLLSTAVSVMVWKEPLGLGKMAGISLLLLSVSICTSSRSKESCIRGWKFYSVGYFIFSAAVGITFKFFSHSGVREQANDMMIIAAAVMILLLAGMASLEMFQGIRKCGVLSQSVKISVSLVSACGILSCFYNRLNAYLSGALQGTFFFPVFNGGTVIVSFVLGKLVLNEKIEKRQIWGLIFGIIAIFMIGLC